MEEKDMNGRLKAGYVSIREINITHKNTNSRVLFCHCYLWIDTTQVQNHLGSFLCSAVVWWCLYFCKNNGMMFLYIIHDSFFSCVRLLTCTKPTNTIYDCQCNENSNDTVKVEMYRNTDDGEFIAYFEQNVHVCMYLELSFWNVKAKTCMQYDKNDKWR